PALVKRDFPQDKGTLTSSYAVLIGVTAASGAAAAVPLAHDLGLGWQAALLSPLVLAVPAALFWLPRFRHSRTVGTNASGQAPPLTQALHRSWLAWQVTLFLGLNSFIFFLLVGWMPAMLQDVGY